MMNKLTVFEKLSVPQVVTPLYWKSGLTHIATREGWKSKYLRENNYRGYKIALCGARLSPWDTKVITSSTTLGLKKKEDNLCPRCAKKGSFAYALSATNVENDELYFKLAMRDKAREIEHMWDAVGQTVEQLISFEIGIVAYDELITLNFLELYLLMKEGIR